MIKHYKTKNGIADALLDMEGQKIIVEIKNYGHKNVTMHEIKQLNRYIQGTPNCCSGILVTKQDKWKKGKVYIENNRISIIPSFKIIRGLVV